MIFCVWDVEKGEMIYKEEGMNPLAYNRKSKEFITIDENGKFKFSKFKKRPA